MKFVLVLIVSLTAWTFTRVLRRRVSKGAPPDRKVQAERAGASKGSPLIREVLAAGIAGLLVLFASGLWNRTAEQRKIVEEVRKTFDAAYELYTAGGKGNLIQAISIYEVGLARLEPSFDLELYCQLQQRAGEAYYQVGQYGDLEDNLEKALRHFEEALAYRDRVSDPIGFATTKISIGGAHRFLSTVREAREHTNLAIEALNEAQSVATPDSYQYGRSHYYLGMAYRDLSDLENPLENMKRSLVSLEKALVIFELEKFPKEFSAVNTALAKTYRELAALADPEVNARKSLEAIQQTFKANTLENNPDEWALNQTTLGIAYYFLSDKSSVKKEQLAALASSLEAYRRALQVRTLEYNPFGYAQTTVNVGHTMDALALATDDPALLWKAIEAYEETLKVFTPRKEPKRYASTLVAMAESYRSLAVFEPGEDHLSEAFRCFDEALEVLTKESDPQGYADLICRRGEMYLNLVEDANSQRYLEKSVRDLGECLSIFTLEESPAWNEVYSPMLQEARKQLDTRRRSP